MDTFAQQFTTSWISGGVRIKAKMVNVKTWWSLNNAVETGVVDPEWAYYYYFYDTNKAWTNDEWIGYYVGWTSGSGVGLTRYIINSSLRILEWSSDQSIDPYVSGNYGIFVSPSDFYEEEDPSDGIIPNRIKLELFSWNTSYSITVSGTPLVTDYSTVSSEEIESDENWIYLFWGALPAGTYLWRITPIDGDDTGSLKILYDPDSSKFQSWKNTAPLDGDYFSEVMGLDGETYENVMSLGDSFSDGFIANDGTSNIKVKKSSAYYNAIKTGNIATTAGGLKGRIATGSYVHII